MSEPFLSQISIVGFNFAPRGWAFCDGQILPINQNQALYSLLGTTYGGDGRTSFALPDLRGRTPVHPGSGTSGHNIQLGQKSGEETHTLTTAEMPSHNHTLKGSTSPGNQASPVNHVYADTGAQDPEYHSGSSIGQMGASSLTNAGGGQAHENMQPFLTLNYVIALQGLFPSRN
ncbi:MAG: tail fiber protein [Chitinophagales bacterium]